MDAPNIANYHGLELIGMGGFSRVYRARHVNTGRAFAIKLVTVGSGERSNRFARFRRELMLCRELYHPHIVGLVDQGEVDGVPYAVFEYVDGVTLGELVRREGPLPAQRTTDLMGQVLDALSCAHGIGVVHRDLKPSNIMVSRTGASLSAKVLDFGIGAFLPGVNPDQATLTRSMETLGTPSYVSPEQLRGDPVTERADLYAWGLVFLECMIGRPVLMGATIADLFHQHLSSTEIALPPAIRRHALGKLLRRALRKNSAQRASSAAELLSELKSLHVADLVGELGEEVTGAGAATAIEPTWIGATGTVTRRQITSLSCAIGIVPNAGVKVDSDVLATLMADQVASCAESCAEFGGTVVGVLGSQVLVHFGAHESRDSEPRLAARTAVHVVEQLARRSRRLEKSTGLGIDIRVGIDVGMVLALRDGRIMGLTDAVATRLANFAPPGTIVASEAARRLLARHVEVVADVSRPLPGEAEPQTTYLVQGLRDDSTGSLHSPTDGPLVGRQADVSALLRLLEDATSRSGAAALITGEPGIGKSRLLREVRHDAFTRGWAFQDCRCLPEHANSALYPILELLKREFGIAGATSPAEAVARSMAVLAELPVDEANSIPVVCSWLSLPLPEPHGPSQCSPGRQKEILLEVITAVVERSASRQATLFAIEDIHWADPTTLEFLLAFLRRLPQLRVALVMTARPTPAALLGDGLIRQIRLTGLEPTHIGAVAQAITEGVPLSPAAVDRIAAQTDGVPLFVEEYTRSLLEAGSLRLLGQRYELHEASQGQGQVPVTLRGVLGERLDRSGAWRETVQLAAAIGREFDVHLLAAASSRPVDDVQSDLDRLVRAELVQRQRRRGPTSFAFRHALVRDAAYDSLPKAARQQAHRRLAETLERQFGHLVAVQPGEAARHHAGAGAYDRAVDYAIRAAELSLGRSANQESIGHVRLALAWLGELASHATADWELRLQLMLSQALMGTQGWASPDVKAAIDRSNQLLRTAGRIDQRVAALWALAAYHHTASNRSEFRQIIEDLRQSSNDRSTAMITDSLHGVGLWCDGDFARAEATALRALEAYDPAVDSLGGLNLGFDCRVLSWSLLGVVRAFTSDPEVCVRAGDEALAWARQLRHIPSIGIALLYSAVGFAFLGDRDKARTRVEELLDIAGKYGLPALSAYALLLHGWATGDSSQAPHILAQLRQMGCRLGLPFYTSLLADAAAEAGDLAGAIERIQDCLALCDETGERCYEAELYRRRALYESRLGRDGVLRAQQSWWLAADRAQRSGMHVVELTALHELTRIGVKVPRERLTDLRETLPRLAAALAA